MIGFEVKKGLDLKKAIFETRYHHTQQRCPKLSCRMYLLTVEEKPDQDHSFRYGEYC